MNSTAHDDHYSARNIKPIDVMEDIVKSPGAAPADVRLRVALAIKHMMRAGTKTGESWEHDLDKALNYLHRARFGCWFDGKKSDSIDTVDLLCDNFLRIASLHGSDEPHDREVRGLCHMSNTAAYRRFTVLQERDAFRDRMIKYQAELINLKAEAVTLAKEALEAGIDRGMSEMADEERSDRDLWAAEWLFAHAPECCYNTPKCAVDTGTGSDKSAVFHPQNGKQEAPDVAH